MCVSQDDDHLARLKSCHIRLDLHQKLLPSMNHCTPENTPLATGLVSLAIAPPTPAKTPAVPVCVLDKIFSVMQRCRDAEMQDSGS